MTQASKLDAPCVTQVWKRLRHPRESGDPVRDPRVALISDAAVTILDSRLPPRMTT